MTSLRHLLAVSLAACLVGCSHVASTGTTTAPSGAAQAANWWGGARAPKPGSLHGTIPSHLTTPFLKDPSLVAGGQLVAGQRYLAFGDLRGFYLKRFEVDGRGGPLSFATDETPLRVTGLPARLDALWAPQLRVVGDRLELYYTAGEMPPPEAPHWASFRLHRATMTVAAFARAMAAHQSPEFKDQGTMLAELAPFGPGDSDFGMIDPALFVNAAGRAYMTYTLVRYGLDHGRPHEEFVRYRAVDPQDVSRPLGPDLPLYDGKSGTADDGVAEAQDLVMLRGHAYAFISSRPGDTDQLLLAAPLGNELGQLTRAQLATCLAPGREAWQAKALGSSSAAEIGKACYMIYQGLSADGRFTLGWTTLAL